MIEDNIINKIKDLRPETRFDQAFAQKLRKQLAAGAVATHEGEQHMSFFEKIFSKPAMVLAGAALVVVIAVLSFWDSPLTPDKGGKTAIVSYTATGENGFGPLQELSNVSAGPQSPQAAENMSFGRGQSGGGGGTAMAMPSDTKASPLIYPGPDIVNYRFVYKGEEFPLPGDKVDVYRKVKGSLTAGDISSILNSTGGLMDFSTFGSTKLQSVSFYEDRDDGYQIYVDLLEGMVQINERFPKIMEPQMFGVSEIPDKARMIAAADQFLAEHGVNMDGYGEPEIQEWWLETMTMMAGPEADIMPRVADAAVIYPLLIDGKKALDQSGNPTGLVVNVRISDMKATGLWNLSTRRFESSAYAAETNREKILAMAERGGINNYYYPAGEGDVTVQTVDVELGTPEYAYIQYWKYDGMQSSELYIPAYVFPITSKADVQIWQKYVIVPIVTELIDNMPPYPMPLMMEGSSGAAR